MQGGAGTSALCSIMARSPTLLLAFNGPLLPLCFVVIAPQFVSCHSPRALDARRRAQMEAAGDRQDILAIDGNCKLHRRTCGMPFAEVIASPYLNKLLLRGCSAMPHGRDTLCCKHAGDRDRPQQPRAGETSAQESASQSGRCVSPGNPNARPWWLAAGVHSQRGGLGQVLCLPS